MWLNPTNMQGLSVEQRVGIVPYLTKEELPQTATDAFKGLIVYVTTLQPEEGVKELVEKMEPASIVMAAKGLSVYPPLNDFEHYIMYTLEYCQRKGWLTTDDQAVWAIRSVKEEALKGSLFV